MVGFESYREAAAHLPPDAKWSSTFGNPGEGGFTAYYRAADGRRYVVENGTFGDAWTLACVVERRG